MSILPLRELPSSSESIRLSALDAYAGRPGALLGVTFWPRAAARIIDLVVHFFVAVGGRRLFGLLVTLAAGLQHKSLSPLVVRPGPNIILQFMFTRLVFAGLGFLTFEAICEGFHGSTPGKFLLGMTVVQEDGSPCRPGAAVIRSLAYLLDILFWGIIGYLNMRKSPQQQRHGDEWAHTVVCRRSEVSQQNLRGGGQFALALFFATMADVAVVILGSLLTLVYLTR